MALASGRRISSVLSRLTANVRSISPAEPVAFLSYGLQTAPFTKRNPLQDIHAGLRDGGHAIFRAELD